MITRNKEIKNQQMDLRFNKRWHDFWIAATAVENKLKLVTNNIKDFKFIKGLDYYELESETTS